MTEKLCLKWNDFKEISSTAFGNLRNNTDFTDVTLACEDGQQIEAHKAILATTSPFFQDLLRRNKHLHPLIYMRGVKSEVLMAIIDFLYCGEANIYHENIDAFLSIAEEFNLKGLTGNIHVKEAEEISNDEQSKEKSEITMINAKKSTRTKAEQPKLEKINFKSDERNLNMDVEAKINQNLTERAKALPPHEIHKNTNAIRDLDETVKSLMIKSETILTKRNNRRADKCTVCGKEGEGTNIRNHIETQHLEGVSIPCNDCDQTFSLDKLKFEEDKSKLEAEMARTKTKLVEAVATNEEQAVEVQELRVEVQQVRQGQARRAREVEEAVGLMATLEQEKEELKRSSARLVRKVELLKEDAERLGEEAERARLSPWEDEEWGELAKLEVFHLMRAELVPAQQARLAMVCLEELEETKEKITGALADALDTIAKLTAEKTKLGETVCLLENNPFMES